MDCPKGYIKPAPGEACRTCGYRKQCLVWGENRTANFPDLADKRAVILGLQGSGKSKMAEFIMTRIKDHIIYDVHHEHQGFNRYLVENKNVRKPGDNKDPAIAELNEFVEGIILGKHLVRLFVLDEANRYCRNNYPLPSSILTLNDDNRHDKIAFVSVARRAVQLSTDLVELAHYLFIFRLPGKNDRQYLEGLAEGLGDAVRKLPEFHYIEVGPNRDYRQCKPIPIGTKTASGS